MHRPACNPLAEDSILPRSCAIPAEVLSASVWNTCALLLEKLRQIRLVLRQNLIEYSFGQ